jgi:hypothetical protein
MRESLKIVGLGIVSAVIYGEIQDHSLIRYCPEYFTVFHPNVFGTKDPTMLAFGWGILATWWVGLILGIALAFAAQSGEWPRRTWRSLLPGVLVLFLVTGLATLVGLVGAGAAGFTAPDYVLGPAANLEHGVKSRVSFMLAAYNTSYLVALVGGVLLCVSTWLKRRKAARGAPA